jgi:hypothetical protein
MFGIGLGELVVLGVIVGVLLAGTAGAVALVVLATRKRP